MGEGMNDSAKSASARAGAGRGGTLFSARGRPWEAITKFKSTMRASMCSGRTDRRDSSEGAQHSLFLEHSTEVAHFSAELFSFPSPLSRLLFPIALYFTHPKIRRRSQESRRSRMGWSKYWTGESKCTTWARKGIGIHSLYRFSTRAQE